MAADFYLDRLDNILSINMDPDSSRWLEVCIQDYFTDPITGVTKQAPVSEGVGGMVTITSESIVSYDGEAWLRFRASGLGAVGTSCLATFRFAYGDSEQDDITIRFRAATR